ncbi:MAG: hypothetical protein QNJ71_06660 [Acidimicrobiia bacterium]|nr:hypothetical protein [Acidimicrobiia bacterium]
MEPRTSQTTVPEPKGGAHHTRLWVTIGVLLLVVAALTAWIVVDQTRSEDAAVPEDIEQLINDYLRAYQDQDEAAIRSLSKPSFTVDMNVYAWAAGTLTRVDRVESDIEQLFENWYPIDPTVELLGPMSMEGDADGPWFVAVGERWLDVGGWGESGMSIYVVVEEKGELLVAGRMFAGESIRER